MARFDARVLLRLNLRAWLETLNVGLVWGSVEAEVVEESGPPGRATHCSYQTSGQGLRLWGMVNCVESLNDTKLSGLMGLTESGIDSETSMFSYKFNMVLDGQTFNDWVHALLVTSVQAAQCFKSQEDTAPEKRQGLVALPPIKVGPSHHLPIRSAVNKSPFRLLSSAKPKLQFPLHSYFIRSATNGMALSANQIEIGVVEEIAFSDIYTPGGAERLADGTGSSLSGGEVAGIVVGSVIGTSILIVAAVATGAYVIKRIQTLHSIPNKRASLHM